MTSAIYEINKYFNTNQIFALVLPPHLEIHAQVALLYQFSEWFGLCEMSTTHIDDSITAIRHLVINQVVCPYISAAIYIGKS